jgi:hypothetical protein
MSNLTAAAEVLDILKDVSDEDCLKTIRLVLVERGLNLSSVALKGDVLPTPPEKSGVEASSGPKPKKKKKKTKKKVKAPAAAAEEKSSVPSDERINMLLEAASLLKPVAEKADGLSPDELGGLYKRLTKLRGKILKSFPKGEGVPDDIVWVFELYPGILNSWLAVRNSFLEEGSQ